MYCRSWRKKSCFSMPHGPRNEQMWCQSGQCSVTIAQFPQRPTIWPCVRNVTRSTSFTGPLLTSSVSSTSNAYTTIAVSSSHVGITIRFRSPADRDESFPNHDCAFVKGVQEHHRTQASEGVDEGCQESRRRNQTTQNIQYEMKPAINRTVRMTVPTRARNAAFFRFMV